jgi:hypothetical protein
MFKTGEVTDMKRLLLASMVALLLASCGPKTRIVLDHPNFTQDRYRRDSSYCSLQVKQAIAGRNVAWHFADGMFYDCMGAMGWQATEVPDN